MDPNANLAEMRRISKDILAIWNTADPVEGTITPEQAELVAEKAETLSEMFQGLDQWIVKRGYLPREWRKH